MLEGKKLDKGVIIGREQGNNEIGLHLCLGYDKEKIDDKLDEWYLYLVTSVFKYKAKFTKDMIDYIDVLLDDIAITSYDIGIIKVIIEGKEDVLENYKKGKVRGNTDEQIDRVFEEPCYNCFIYALIKGSEKNYVCLQREGEVDTWLLNSILMGTCSTKKYYTRDEMKTYIQDELYSRYEKSLWAKMR